MAKWKDWVVDYMYRARGILIFRRQPPAHYLRDKHTDKKPVILLSGLSLKWSFLRQLGDRISQAGHPVFVVPNLQGNYLNIAQSAATVRQLIDTHSLHNVVIVAHSKGGLVGKYLLVHHNQDDRIQAVIAIAAPFSGTKLANFIPHRAFQEISLASQTVQALKSSAHVNERITSIIPAFDNHVWHQDSSYLEGAHNIQVNVRGHHKVVFDKETQDIVLNLKGFVIWQCDAAWI